MAPSEKRKGQRAKGNGRSGEAHFAFFLGYCSQKVWIRQLAVFFRNAQNLGAGAVCTTVPSPAYLDWPHHEDQLGALSLDTGYRAHQSYV